MKRLFFILTVLLIGLQPLMAKMPAYHNPVAPEMPILAWYSILPDSAQTPERYAELREAGFNISFSHFDTNGQIARALEAAEGSGVKLMLTSYDLWSDTEGTVRRFSGNPGVAGWFLRDEPTGDGFAPLADLGNRIAAIDSTHLIYLNLLPSLVPANDLKTKDYEEYVQRFVNEVDLPQISFDLYPIVQDPATGQVYPREQLFENLEIVSRVARRTGRPFWAFCLATAHDPYPVPNAAHMHYEAFSALAYGAQGIQYFTYWQPKSMQWNFHNAPVDETGRRTDVYYLVRDLNREIQALAPVFLGAEDNMVRFFGDNLPAGVTALEEMPSGVKNLAADGLGMLVSQFCNGDARYLMLVSRDINHSQTVDIDCTASFSQLNPDGTARPFSANKLTLAPGGYLLLKYNL